MYQGNPYLNGKVKVHEKQNDSLLTQNKTYKFSRGYTELNCSPLATLKIMVEGYQNKKIDIYLTEQVLRIILDTTKGDLLSPNVLENCRSSLAKININLTLQ